MGRPGLKIRVRFISAKRELREILGASFPSLHWGGAFLGWGRKQPFILLEEGQRVIPQHSFGTGEGFLNFLPRGTKGIWGDNISPVFLRQFWGLTAISFSDRGSNAGKFTPPGLFNAGD